MSEIRIDQDLDPTFTRATAANKKDGTSAASGVVRYENVIESIVVDTKREWDRGTYTRMAASGNVITSEAWRPTFTRSSSGFIDGTAYDANTPRFAGEILEYGTTNLLSANQSNVETNTTGFSTVGSSAISRVTTQAWQGTASLQVVTNGLGAGEGVNLGAVVSPSGLIYTVSAYVKGSGTISINMLHMNGGGYITATAGSSVVLNDTWQRVSVSGALTATATSLILQVATKTTAQAVTFYVDGLQVERNPSATSWIVGGSSRATTYSTGAIMIEESSTNLCFLSEGFDNASWGKTGCTVTANTVVAPDGNTAAEKVVEDTSTGGHYIAAPSIATTASTPYTYSVYAKAGERNVFWLVYTNYSNWVGGEPEYEFNLITGTATNRGSASNVAGMTYVGDGWYRCWMTVTTTSGGTLGTRGNIYVMNASSTSASYTGDGTSGMYFWGAQIEAKAYPTTYIPTPGSANVSRSSDNLKIPADGIINASAGTAIIRAYVDAEIAKSTGSTNAHILLECGNSSGSAANLWALYKSAAATTYTARTSNSAGTTSAIASTGSVVALGWHTFAIRWSSTELSFWVDGVKNIAASNPNLLSSIEQYLYIGVGRTGVQHWDQPIDFVNVFNTALSDADMTAYTAASGYSIPMRSDTTLQMNFADNLNFATSGVYVSEWLNMGVSGAVLSASGSVTTPTGTSALVEYRTANSDSQTDASAWSTTLGTGKYAQFRHTLVSAESTASLPYVTSTTVYQGQDYGKAITIEESTVNLLTSPTSPAAQDVTVTAAGDYNLSIVGTDSSSGSVVIEHKREETTTADFSAGTLVGTQSTSNELQLDTATADPTFTRATVATKRDTSSVASGAARYEDIIRQFTLTSQGDFDACGKTGPIQTSPAGNVQLGVIEDGFDTDTSWAYTNYGTGNLTATFNTASSRLELSEPGAASNEHYVYNNFTAKNAATEAVISQSNGGGFVLRLADASNNYLIWLYDDTVSATNNVYIYKRVAGASTLLAGPVNITFTRGTQYTFRAEIVDSSIKLYQDGTLVASASDSALTAAGKFGFIQSSNGVATLIHSFKIDTATPLFGRNSAANNPQSAAAVATNIPRYVKGKNLLTKNQSDFETSATSDMSQNGGGTVTRTLDSTEFWQGTKSLKCVCDGTSASQGFYTNNTLGANMLPGVIPAGSTIVGSLYLKGSGTLNVRMQVNYTDLTNSVNTQSYTMTSSWQRCSTSIALTAGKTVRDAYLVVYTIGSQAVTFYADGAQIELGSTPTTWVPGGDNAILVEESTTNIMTAGCDDLITGWNNFGGASSTRSTGQADPFGGTNAYRIQTTGGSNISKYYIGFGTSVNGTKYSQSVWVKNVGTSTVTVHPNIAVTSATVSNTDGWKLVKSENMTGNGSSTLSMYFQTAAAGDDLDIYVMWPQTEAKAYCTSYIAPGSTRNAEQVNLSSWPASGAVEGSVILTAYFSGDKCSASQTRNYELFNTNSAASTNGVRIVQAISTRRLLARVYGSGSATSDATWNTPTITEGWHKVGMRWSATSVSLWFDGTMQASGSVTQAINALPVREIALGTLSAAGQWNDPIDDLAIYPTALSDAEMSAYTTNS